MKKNMGATDKAIRLIIAVITGALYFSNVITGAAAVLLLILAVVFALTSFIRFCPLYALFGINTCKKK